MRASAAIVAGDRDVRYVSRREPPPRRPDLRPRLEPSVDHRRDRRAARSTRRSRSSSRIVPTRPGLRARATPASRRVCVEPARLRRPRRLRSRRWPTSLQARDVDLVCLAGFMRLVGAPLLEAFPNRILNIHPSLLPSFPGLDAQRQALEHGVACQRRDGPSRDRRARRRSDRRCRRRCRCWTTTRSDTLSARILVEEHRLYPEAIAMRARRRLANRRPTVRADATSAADVPTSDSVRRKRQHRDFRRAVDPHRHVDRSDAAAHEDRRVVLSGDARRRPETSARRPRRRRAARPGRRGCGRTAPAGCSSAAASVSRRGSWASRMTGARGAAHDARRCRDAAWSRSGCRPVRALRLGSRSRVRASLSTSTPLARQRRRHVVVVVVVAEDREDAVRRRQAAQSASADGPTNCRSPQVT